MDRPVSWELKRDILPTGVALNSPATGLLAWPVN